MSLCEYIPVFDLCVDFGGVLFECDGFDGSLLLEGESVAFVVEFPIFSEWYFGFGLLVQTDFFGIFVGFSAYAAGGLLLRRSYLDF